MSDIKITEIEHSPCGILSVKRDPKKELKVYLAVIIICLAAAIILMILMFSAGRECSSNPFVYGAKKIGGVQCECIKSLDTAPFIRKFSFNDTGLQVEEFNNEALLKILGNERAD